MADSRNPFYFGAATSSHQVEGGNRFNDWWQWEAEGRVREPSGPACNHYERFRGDAGLAAQLGHTAHRFSIEWSRVEPAEGDWNEEALEHYRAVILDLRSRGMEPFVTLH